MPFCIHCGAANQPDAAFCLSCGQLLYHEPRTAVGKKPLKTGRRQLLILVSVFVALGALVVVFSIGRTGKVNRSDSSALKEIASNSEAVLTVFAMNRSGFTVSQGSGFILSSDGLAGSNYHVLEDAAQATAECCNGRVFQVRSIEGADLDKDLVVFQLYERGTAYKPQNLPHVTLGSSKDLAVGEKVMVIGSPHGLENTLSDGILSAVREYDSVRVLQITAPISPGSSGGPVLNASGQMIGVATFQFEKGQNLNFAIGAEYISPLLDEHFQISLAGFRSIVRRAQRKQRNPAESEGANAPPQKWPAAEALTGQFGGVVHNRSAGVSAEFGIVVQDTEGVLSGCMVVGQPLFGSGPLVGFAADSDVSFAVTSAVGTITFLGHRQNGAINGTYTVEHEGSPGEEGTFNLRKVKSQGPGRDFHATQCPTDAEVNK